MSRHVEPATVRHRCPNVLTRKSPSNAEVPRHSASLSFRRPKFDGNFAISREEIERSLRIALSEEMPNQIDMGPGTPYEGTIGQ